jgi:hypothetical protein
MIKERYRNEIGYLHPRITHNPPTWASEGTQFRFNKSSKNKSILNPVTGMYKTSASEIWETDTQLDFKSGYKVTNKKLPYNDGVKITLRPKEIKTIIFEMLFK